MDAQLVPEKKTWTAGRLLILSLLFAGACFTLGLQFVRTDEVFFTGDDGVKTMMVRQFADGLWQTDLQLETEPWIRNLWDNGLYPFGPPFIYNVEGHRFIQYPLIFPALTAPFYMWFGSRGLTILPLLGVWIIWAFFLIACRRCGFDLISTAFGLTGLIFASTLTLYSAMVSEHTLAVGLSFAGFTLAIVPENRSLSRWESIVAGLLLGCAFWLRPESGVYMIGAFAVLLWINKADLPHLIQAGLAAVIPIALYLGMNMLLFDLPLGFHGTQNYVPGQGYPDMSPVDIAVRLGDKLIYYYPVVLLLFGLTLINLLIKQSRQNMGNPSVRYEKSIWIGIFIFCLVSSFLLPNDGGKQYGPRYWLHLIPWIWFLATTRFEALRRVKTKTAQLIMGVLIVLTVIGVWLSSVDGTRLLITNYRERTLPALKLVRQMKVDVIVVSHQWISQELEAAFDITPFVRVRTDSDFLSLVRAMAAEKRTKLLWFGLRPHIKPSGTMDGLAWRFTPPKKLGEYFVFAGSVWSIDEQ